MLAFNDSMTHPQGTTIMTLTIGEGAREMKMILNFLVISGKSVFRDITWRSFLAKLDAVAFPAHLKVTYHIMGGRLATVGTELKAAK